MFPINSRKIKKRFKDYFDPGKRIKRNLKLKTEKIERECEMYSLHTGKKHKIQYRLTIIGIQIEDGTFQFEYGARNDDIFHNHIKREDYPKLDNDPVLKAIDIVSDEILKNLGIYDLRKKK